jgi:xanthine dehydrogenase YagS FAD-binding subunit
MLEPVYRRAADVSDAVKLAGGQPQARYLGGGTNLIDLMREGAELPQLLVDVARLSGEITLRDNGNLVIGASVKNTAVAADPHVREKFPLLSRAILAGASGQIRNMATVGGNIMQRTRCYYFYDGAGRCNKRSPGSGCDAAEGFNRIHAILGASPSCVATHPSDMCVALAALDALVHLEGPGGTRSIRLVDLHRLPGDTPERETELEAGELITAVELPAMPFAVNAVFRKVRDRASYAFALVSLAAALEVEDGLVKNVRLALGGVAHKPWRATKAEAALQGAPATDASFARAADAELESAVGLRDNAFKIELVRRVMTHALRELSGAGP